MNNKISCNSPYSVPFNVGNENTKPYIQPILTPIKGKSSRPEVTHLFEVYTDKIGLMDANDIFLLPAVAACLKGLSMFCIAGIEVQQTFTHQNLPTEKYVYKFYLHGKISDEVKN